MIITELAMNAPYNTCAIVPLYLYALLCVLYGWVSSTMSISGLVSVGYPQKGVVFSSAWFQHINNIIYIRLQLLSVDGLTK